MRRQRFALLLAGVLCAGLMSGCKKADVTDTGPDSPAIQAAHKLPDGDAVLKALDQKDYEGAVGTLTKMQAAVSGSELEPQYMTLKMHVREKLMDVADKDPKAAEALNALRMSTSGR